MITEYLSLGQILHEPEQSLSSYEPQLWFSNCSTPYYLVPMLCNLKTRRWLFRFKVYSMMMHCSEGSASANFITMSFMVSFDST